MADKFGIRHVIGAPVTMTRLTERPVVCMPPRSTKFSISEWRRNNDARSRNAEDQQQLAETILGECQRVREETEERCKILKATSDRRIEERMQDVEFNKNELSVQRKEVCIELEALSVYKNRVQDCLVTLESNALNICRKCLMLRDSRLGIDLVADDVEKALQEEITTILGAQNLLQRALEQLNEQMRQLRSTRYQLDRDLEYKQAAIDLEKGALSLNHTDLSLPVHEGKISSDPADISMAEYSMYSRKNIEQAARDVAAARPIRVFVDNLLKQITDDLWEAYNKCNHAFNERIKETKNCKGRLEDMHSDITRKVCEMQKNIMELEKALADKEGYIGVAHSRLGTRSQRPAAELVRDSPRDALYLEFEMLRHSTEQLQQMLQEAKTSLRYLLQTQIQLEEDINVKMNSLKIDEVDCMSLRATMNYNAY